MLLSLSLAVDDGDVAIAIVGNLADGDGGDGHRCSASLPMVCDGDVAIVVVGVIVVSYSRLQL